MELDIFLYPISIWQARYGGVYEGGAWVAFGGQWNPDGNSAAFGGDNDCARYWQSKDAEYVGRGATPQAALDDLRSRNADFEERMQREPDPIFAEFIASNPAALPPDADGKGEKP